MPTPDTVRKRNDDVFFHSVANERVLAQALSSLGFCSPWFFVTLGNAGMGTTKEAWTLDVPESNHALNIHFEARTRNEFRIEIGPEPYVSSINHKPEVKTQLSALLKKKADIIELLRVRLIDARELTGDVIASRSNLLNAHTVSAHTIVKFASGLTMDVTPAQAAGFFSNVILSVTPLVDQALLRLGNYCS